ncbi:hypothetical protein NDN16_17690 [Aureimonas altamirensis]|uniref:hypothetical protein n=1 Tax=Aureimonas altamirensis TaxID=370622 RepID=UPI002037086A|nr:hypothetical protein [Aureimonas altamirensis]MCM2505503.1 hypothetical protein [Aureimonas altamirensis]
MSDRKTIAFWCEKSKGAGDTGAEYHVNLWHFSDRKRSDFFEVGILVDDPSAICAIRIFVPIHLDRGQIRELGAEFAEPNLAQGIFNEPLSPRYAGNKRSVELEGTKGIYCGVHVFSTGVDGIDLDELMTEHVEGGTLISITAVALQSLHMQSSDTVRQGYFRFRIMSKTPKERPFVTYIAPQDQGWTSGFDAIEYIDCRLNEARTLPRSIALRAESTLHGVAKTHRVVFLAVVPVVSSITSSHAEWHKSRLLENEIWEKYVPQGLNDGMVVYHWRKITSDDETKPLNGFSAFVKIDRVPWSGVA